MAVVELAVNASVWMVGAVMAKFAAPLPVRVADTMSWFVSVSAGLALTTIVAVGGVPVVVLQFKVIVDSAVVPLLANVASRLVACSITGAASNAARTGKIREA